MVNSLHYGGSTCTGVGAMAADFNTISGTAADEAALKAAMQAIDASGACPGSRVYSGHTTHTHMDMLPYIAGGGSC